MAVDGIKSSEEYYVLGVTPVCGLMWASTGGISSVLRRALPCAVTSTGAVPARGLGRFLMSILLALEASHWKATSFIGPDISHLPSDVRWASCYLRFRKPIVAVAAAVAVAGVGRPNA